MTVLKRFLLIDDNDDMGVSYEPYATSSVPGVIKTDEAGTFTSNENDQFSVTGMKTKDGRFVYDWIGTLAEYQAAKTAGTIQSTWMCFITDDSGGGGGGGADLPDQTGNAGKFLRTDGTEASWQYAPFRNIGELVYSPIPLADAGLHLLDGTLIPGDGIYANFVTHMAQRYTELSPDAKTISNVDKVGTVLDNNHVISHFSASDYAVIPYGNLDVSNGETWEAVFEVTTGSDISTTQYFCGSSNVGDSHDPFIIGIYNNSFHVYLVYANDPTTNINLDTQVVPTANTTYTFKVEFTGTAYNIYVNDVLKVTQSSSSSLRTGNLILGIQSGSGVLLNPWLGSINLTNSYIKVDDEYWWQGTRQEVPGFTDEFNWTRQVYNYGVCGKFVYDSVNNTIRLPKITGLIEGTTELSALGELIEAGLPALTTSTQAAHSHTRGTMDITANVYNIPLQSKTVTFYRSGAFYDSGSGGSSEALKSTAAEDAGTNIDNIGFKASKSWTGSTSEEGAHSHTISWGANTDTVQPQTIQMYIYMVISNFTKTTVENNIDNIASDLNTKADTNLLNISTSIKQFDSKWTSAYLVIYSGSSLAANTNYDISSYLPNDGYNYEVLVTAYGTSGTTSGNNIFCIIHGDLIASWTYLFEGKASSAAATGGGNGSIFIGPDRTVTLYGASSNTGTINVRLIGYRRIGLNQ